MKIDDTIAAIVTGGASGLGRASAQALADAGAKVAIFDINEEAGEAFAQEIGGVFCNVNIMSEESVIAGFEKARATNGQERLLIHCAIVSGGGKTLVWNKEERAYKRTPTEIYENAIQGILVASYRMASISALGMAAAEPLNEDHERGCIILTSSVAAQDGQIGQVGYGSGKSGVNGMVLPMARDLMDIGVRVNAIMPGTFATPPMLRVREKNEAVFENLSKSVPFPKRLGKPEEFASLVMELGRNIYFNGQCIRLDGAIRMPPR